MVEAVLNVAETLLQHGASNKRAIIDTGATGR